MFTKSIDLHIFSKFVFIFISVEVQGGDTRREEVLSKVLVDISIHTTSHASDTAQNKLCSFWMGPVLLWSVIN